MREYYLQFVNKITYILFLSFQLDGLLENPLKSQAIAIYSRNYQIILLKMLVLLIVRSDLPHLW